MSESVLEIPGYYLKEETDTVYRLAVPDGAELALPKRQVSNTGRKLYVYAEGTSQKSDGTWVFDHTRRFASPI